MAYGQNVPSCEPLIVNCQNMDGPINMSTSKWPYQQQTTSVIVEKQNESEERCASPNQ